ncbi:MAG: transglutaminase-like domain-containing protein, partial [Peptococcaceae bacterium]
TIIIRMQGIFMFNRIKEELDKGFFPSGMLFTRNLQAGFYFSKVMIKQPVRFTGDIVSTWMKRIKVRKPVWAPLYEEKSDYITEDDLAGVSAEDILRATSNEKYLRPTRLCKPNAPEIVALAKKLGAWEKSDRDYAEAIFKFMRQIKFEFNPLKTEVEVLKTNRGVCLDQQSLAIALARAGGVPARYSIIGLEFSPPVRSVLTVDPFFKEVYDALEFWEMHGAAEFMIDGKWIGTDVTFSDEAIAGLGLPMPQFGSADVGLGVAPPEIIVTFEGFPFGYKMIMQLSMSVMRGMSDRINTAIEEITENGRRLLEEIGEEKYSEMILSKKAVYKNNYELPSLEEVEAFRKKS